MHGAGGLGVITKSEPARRLPATPKALCRAPGRYTLWYFNTRKWDGKYQTPRRLADHVQPGLFLSTHGGAALNGDAHFHLRSLSGSPPHLYAAAKGFGALAHDL